MRFRATFDVSSSLLEGLVSDTIELELATKDNLSVDKRDPKPIV